MQAISPRWLSPTRDQDVAFVQSRTNRLKWIAIIVLGLALRCWSPAMKSDLWYDEVYSYIIARRSLSDLIRALYLGGDTNPPLYAFLLHFWLKLGDSDTHIKLFSLIFSVAATLVLYKAANRIAGSGVALISCLLMATSQSVITYSVAARPYSLFLFLSLLSTHFLLSAIDQGRASRQSPRSSTWTWVRYGALSTLMVYTHWFGLLVLLVQASALAVYRPWSRRVVIGYLRSLVAIGICCLPLAFFLRNQIELQNSAGGYGWPGKPGLASLVNLASFIAGGRNLLVMAVAAIIIWRLAAGRPRRMHFATKRHIVFFAVYLLVPVAAVFVLSNVLANNSFFVQRYFLPFIISFYILFGVWLARINKRIRALLLLAFISSALIRTATRWRAPETPYSRMASILPHDPGKLGLIAHLSPMSYYPLLHYAGAGQAPEKIVCASSALPYEVDYNVRARMLARDELVELDALRKYSELWLIIDPLDRDRKVADAYDYIRRDGGFSLESEEHIGACRVEHYLARYSAVVDRVALSDPTSGEGTRQ